MVRLNKLRVETMLINRMVLVHVARVRDVSHTLRVMRECIDNINTLFHGHTPLIKFEILGDKNEELNNQLQEISQWWSGNGYPATRGIIVQYNLREFRKPERYDYHIW